MTPYKAQEGMDETEWVEELHHQMKVSQRARFARHCSHLNTQPGHVCVGSTHCDPKNGICYPDENATFCADCGQLLD